MTMSDEENRMTIGLTLSEMLERAVLFEQHIEKYPNNVSTEAASRLYEEIATHAITGGYDRTAGVSHYYQEILNGEEYVDDIEFLTTLAGYVHYKLTGKTPLIPAHIEKMSRPATHFQDKNFHSRTRQKSPRKFRGPFI